MKYLIKNTKTGADLEASFFGNVVDAVRKKPDSQAVLVHEHQFHGAIKQVKAMQKSRFDWDPFKPKTGPANLLYLSVIEYLPTSLGHDLGIYAAIGTVLDHYGMDGFMMTKGIVVGIDLTLNEDEVELEKKRLWASHAHKIGRPIVIVEKRHLEREGGTEHYGKAIAKYLVDLFEIQKGEKASRRLKRLHNRYRPGEQDEDVELMCK